MNRRFTSSCFLIFISLFFGLALKGQINPVMGTADFKNQILSYLNILTLNKEELIPIENRLSYELKEPKNFILFQEIILEKLQENPDDLNLAELLSWQYIRQKQFDKAIIQEIALDKREKGDGFRLLNLGRICFRNEDLKNSVFCYDYILKKGKEAKLYRLAKKERLKSLEFESEESGIDQVSLHTDYQEFIHEFNVGEDVDEVKLNLAKLDIEYLGKVEEARQILSTLLLSNSNTLTFKAECKFSLAKADLLKGLVWESALLFNQVHFDFKEEPLGQEALFEASKIYYYTGDFKLAKSELDVLKTATSDVTANDALDLSLLIQKNLEEDSTGLALRLFARSELYIYQHRLVEAEKILDSISSNYPHNSLADDILMAKYRMAFFVKNYVSAFNNLEKIILSYPRGIWADNALFLLGELNEKSFKNPQKASEYYEKLILNYPGSYFVAESRKRFRKLRGDSLN